MNVHILKDELQQILDKDIAHREMLFRRGYLLSDVPVPDKSAYPFYGLWKELILGRYYLYVQEKQTVYVARKNGLYAVIIGHAYNPFDMTYREEELCEHLLTAYQDGVSIYFDKISEFTGLHIVVLIDGEHIMVCQDACSLTGCYFGTINEHIYVAEHPQLIADICSLKMDDKVQKLVLSKCYNIGNRHLPGNITPYKELKRLGANTYLDYFHGQFRIKRFYPVAPHPEFTSPEEKEKAVHRIGDLIHNGIKCCSQKWNRCTISLSGGTDSKTTLACANGLYEKFSYFSFHSKPQELIDAKGAKTICDRLGLKHTLYTIPGENNTFDDFDLTKKILQHNTNYFVNLADHEIRKFLYLHNLDAYDIELKSWASEVARVFLERKYQVKMPETLNERHCSIFQTRYFGHPLLLKWSDKCYYSFLREIGLHKPIHNFEHTDLFYWEVRMGCWGVSVISAQQLYHRVTMPMNNRKILELFLSMPHEERKSDKVHRDVIAYKNQGVLDAQVEIPNLYFHTYRIMMEKLYFYFRMMFYRPLK